MVGEKSARRLFLPACPKAQRRWAVLGIVNNPVTEARLARSAKKPYPIQWKSPETLAYPLSHLEIGTIRRTLGDGLIFSLVSTQRTSPG